MAFEFFSNLIGLFSRGRIQDDDRPEGQIESVRREPSPNLAPRPNSGAPAHVHRPISDLERSSIIVLDLELDISDIGRVDAVITGMDLGDDERIVVPYFCSLGSRRCCP